MRVILVQSMDMNAMVVTRHPDLPGYPGPADIELYKLKKQGMSWEREIRSDIDWK